MSEAKPKSGAVVHISQADVSALACCGMSPSQLVERVKELEGVLRDAVDSGIVPKSSASDGGASKYSAQVHVADRIRAALAKSQGENT